MGCCAAHSHVRYYYELLQESNLTWAEIQVEKEIIKEQEPIFLFIGLIFFAIVFVISIVNDLVTYLTLPVP